MPENTQDTPSKNKKSLPVFFLVLAGIVLITGLVLRLSCRTGCTDRPKEREDAPRQSGAPENITGNEGKTLPPKSEEKPIKPSQVNKSTPKPESKDPVPPKKRSTSDDGEGNPVESVPVL